MFLAVGRVGSTSENITQKVVWVEEAVSVLLFSRFSHLVFPVMKRAQKDDMVEKECCVCV